MGGWTSGLSSTPKSCAQRWKVPVGGWTRMWVPVQPRKVRFRDESHQWGGWTSCLSSTPKSCAQRWKVPVRGWTRMWVPVQPRKVKFRDESHQWGLNLGSEFNPEKLCSEMKGTSGGLNQDVGSSSTPKSEVQRWKPSMRVEPRVWVQPRKVVLRDDLESGTVRKSCRAPETERVDWSFKSKGIEILRVQPVGDLYTGSKARPPGAKNSAGSFRTPVTDSVPTWVDF